MDSKEQATGVIVVGVDASVGAKAALRFGLEEARLRQATQSTLISVGLLQQRGISATGSVGTTSHPSQ